MSSSSLFSLRPSCKMINGNILQTCPVHTCICMYIDISMPKSENLIDTAVLDGCLAFALGSFYFGHLAINSCGP